MTGKYSVKSKYGIIVDLEKCVGCYACEVACKQENSDAQGVPWIRVHTVGPKVINGNLKLDYIPRILDGCTFCRQRGGGPSCVAHCPTKALLVCSAASMLEALGSNRRYQVCTIKDPVE
jgi:Fe-S-cluster-containing dehydrogenase component